MEEQSQAADPWEEETGDSLFLHTLSTLFIDESMLPYQLYSDQGKTSVFHEPDRGSPCHSHGF